MTRRQIRLLVIALLAVLVAVLVPETARADAPQPESPFNGITSGLLGEPEVIPPHEDPFAPGAKTTIFEQYGTAGLSWETYDQGITGFGDAKDDVTTTLANLMMLPPIAAIAATTSAANLALNPSQMTYLDQPVVAVTSALNESITQPWGKVAFGLAALMLLFALRRMAIGGALTMVAFGLAGLAIVALTVGYPVKAASAMDSTMQGASVSAVSAVQSKGSAKPTTEASKASPGTRLMSGLYEALAYDRWVAGTLGSSDSATARKYGPALFKAHALTWAEGKALQDDPDGRGAEIIEAHQKSWEETAKEVEENDPTAYEYLKGSGSTGGSRIGEAATSFIATAFTIPFLLVVIVMVLLAYVIVRLLVMFGPVTGLLLVIPKFHPLLRSMASVLAAAVINVIVFAVGAAMLIAIANSLLDSEINQFYALILIGVFSMAAWIGLKPFRQVTHLVSNPTSGVNDVMSAPGDAWGTVKKFGGRAAAAGLGSMAGNLAADKIAEAQDDDEETEEATERPEVQHLNVDTAVTPTQVGAAQVAAAPVAPQLAAAPVPAPEVVEGEIITGTRQPFTDEYTATRIPAAAGLPEAPEPVAVDADDDAPRELADSFYVPTDGDGEGVTYTATPEDDGSTSWVPEDSPADFTDGYSRSEVTSGADVFVIYDPDRGDMVETDAATYGRPETEEPR